MQPNLRAIRMRGWVLDMVWPNSSSDFSDVTTSLIDSSIDAYRRMLLPVCHRRPVQTAVVEIRGVSKFEDDTHGVRRQAPEIGALRLEWPGYILSQNATNRCIRLFI